MEESLLGKRYREERDRCLKMLEAFDRTGMRTWEGDASGPMRETTAESRAYYAKWAVEWEEFARRADEREAQNPIGG